MPVGGANSIITGLRAAAGKPRLTLTIEAYGGNNVLLLPHGNNSFFVSGSGTAALVLGGIRPGRVVELVGASGSTVVVTDTAIASSADGTVHLSGSGNFTLSEGSTLILKQRENGSWISVDQQSIN